MNRFEELTAKYLDEMLSAAEVRELANHLRAEPQAAGQFQVFYVQDRVLVELCRSEDLRGIESIMAEIRGEERAFVGSVMQRVRDEGQRRAVKVLPDSLTWLRSAWRTGLVWSSAAAVLLIAFYFLVLRPVVGEPVLLAGKESSVTVERRGKNVLASDKLKLQPDDVLVLGGTNAVAIIYAPENTRLDLQPGTTVKLLDWTRGKRLELRLGQLEASVARQRPLKPLLVRTPNAEARVLGTKFTLTATTNRTHLDVTKGRVRITRTSDGAAVKVGAGDYFVVADGTDMKKALPQTGSLLREIWTGIPGERPWDLLYHRNYPDRPAARDFVKSFETDQVRTNDFGCRLVGYIHPPVTGKYTFWIAVAAEGMLWLSPNENPAEKVRIAEAVGRQMSMPQSPPITLVAGRRYFIQAVQKTARGSSHLAVTWQPPGGEREVIPGEFLSPFKAEGKDKQR